jgi:hypothetical protein
MHGPRNKKKKMRHSNCTEGRQNLEEYEDNKVKLEEMRFFT